MTINFNGQVTCVNINNGSAPQLIVGHGVPPVDAGSGIHSRLCEIRRAVEALEPEQQAELRAALADLTEVSDRPPALREKVSALREQLASAGKDYGAIRQALEDLGNVLSGILPL